MKVYFIPGLAFDHRIFQKLELGGVEFGYLDWIEPERGESIAAYAGRMAEGIEGNGPVALVGHSFGGIVAQEIAAQLRVEQTVLVSSIRSRSEMPRHFRVVRPMGIHWLFTKGLTVHSLGLWGKKHGYETPEEQTLFKDMVRKCSNHYLRWALRTLSVWQAPPPPISGRISQIHGALDRTFPIRHLSDPTHVVLDAGHFMVYKQPERISPLLAPLLSL